MRSKVILILLLAFCIRLVYLSTLPSALFGDVIYHLNLAQNAQIVRWGGDGALFPLFTTIATRITGYSFLTLKLISVILSVITIGVIILYVQELTKSKKAALYAGLFATFSFWSISISHIGKPNAFISLFAVLICYFLLKKQFVRAGLFLGGALYTQAAAWGIFALSFVHPITFIVSMITGVFFFHEFFTAPDTFVGHSSYIGEKIVPNMYKAQSIPQTIFIILENIAKQIRGLFIYGDISFRTNIPGQAHLDPITGFFVIVGVIFGTTALWKMCRDKNWKIKIKSLGWPVGICLIVPFVLIQLAPALDLLNREYIPKHERTSGMIPFVCAVAGYGLWQLEKKLPSRRFKTIFVGIIFLLVATINLYRYWIVYPKTLPNHNVGFAEEIGKRVSSIDSTIPVLVAGCCWADWGQPESNAFEFVPRGKHTLEYVETDSLCSHVSQLQTDQVILYTSPQTHVNDLISSCGWKVSKNKLIEVNGEHVAQETYINVTK